MTRKHFGIVAGVLLILGASTYFGLKIYIEYEARNHIQQWAIQTGRISGLSYQSLDVGLFSKTVKITHVSLQIKDTETPVAIDRLMLHTFDSKNEVPFFMHVGIQGIHVSSSNSFLQGVAPVLAQLGYADFDADVEYAYRYDPMKKNLEIQQIRIIVSGMGRLEVTAKLSNLDLAVVKTVPDNPLMLIALVPALAISRITLDYQDDSLLQRLIQLGARQSNQSQDQYVDGIIHGWNLEIQKQKLPAAREGLMAVQNFIKNPGGIHVMMSPLQPVPLMRFVMTDNIEQFIEILNISINYQEIQK